MQALLILRLTEELGQGITLMKEALTKNGNPHPEFVESADQFKVIFRQGRKFYSDRDIKTLFEERFISQHTLSRRQIESFTGLGPTSAKYLIFELLQEGYLQKVGQGPATRYRKIE